MNAVIFQNMKQLLYTLYWRARLYIIRARKRSYTHVCVYKCIYVHESPDNVHTNTHTSQRRPPAVATYAYVFGLSITNNVETPPPASAAQTTSSPGWEQGGALRVAEGHLGQGTMETILIELW